MDATDRGVIVAAFLSRGTSTASQWLFSRCRRARMEFSEGQQKFAEDLQKICRNYLTTGIFWRIILAYYCTGHYLLGWREDPPLQTATLLAAFTVDR